MSSQDLASLPFTLRQLDVFLKLQELGNFRLTSEALGISQAAVSNQIKALEQQLGFKLLVREPGKLAKPSSSGADFLADLADFREAAFQLASHRRALPEEQPAASSTVTAFVSPYIFDRLVRPKLSKFTRLWKELNFKVDTDYSDIHTSERMRQFDYDIMILHEPDNRSLAPQTLRIATARTGVFGHKKFQESLPKPIALKDLNHLPFVLPTKGSQFERLVLELFRSAGIRPRNIVARAQYFDTMADIIAEGEAVGPVSEPFLTVEQREHLTLLAEVQPLRLTLYRDPKRNGPEFEAVEEFLLSAILAEPAYRTGPLGNPSKQNA